MGVVEISLLAGGIFIFLFASIWLYFDKKTSNLKSKLFLYFMVVIGPIMIYFPTFGPLSGIKNRIKSVQTIESSNVKSIVFQPSRYVKYMHVSMFEKDSVVTDKNSINEICALIRKGEVFIKRSRRTNSIDLVQDTCYTCRLELIMNDDTKIKLGVVKDNNTTVINYFSDGESGWYYASFNVYEFGLLFKDGY
jgi:hypothetical protein